ncbi:MAG: polysaccharide deacetylase family protein [Bilophila wadsworthia]
MTFDDGPSSHTERLMEIAARYSCHVLLWANRSQLPELIVRFAEGTKSATTPIRTVPPSVDAQRSEILSVQELLRKLGVHSRYIRPPYGNFDANTVAIAKAEGADIMLWSIDSMDWSKRASIENMKTLISGQKLRGVFLFHDTHEQTIEALPEILDRLIADGCQFVTVSEYLAALRQDALPEGVNVAAPAIQENPHQPVPAGHPSGAGSASSCSSPATCMKSASRWPEAEGGGDPGAEQMAGHSRI